MAPIDINQPQFRQSSVTEIKNNLIKKCNAERIRLGYPELSYSIQERSIEQLQTLFEHLQNAEPDPIPERPTEPDIRQEQEIHDATIENRQEFAETCDPATGYSKGVTWIVNEIFSYPHLSTGEKLLYLSLWRHCHQTKTCFVGYDKLGQEVSCSEKSVERYLHGYVKDGRHLPGLTGKTRLPNQTPNDTNPPLVSIFRRPNHASRFTLNYKPMIAKPIAKSKKGAAH